MKGAAWRVGGLVAAASLFFDGGEMVLIRARTKFCGENVGDLDEVEFSYSKLT